MQTMEIDRIVEMEKFIQTYANAVQTLGETMNQVSRDHALHKNQSVIEHITRVPTCQVTFEGRQS